MDWDSQIFYQVFVRSFYDRNGDGVGDFAGLAAKLDYLVELGVTALWLNPIFPSDTHHNYFTTDFFDTDPDYGSPADFAALCRAVHDRGMRIFLDMEPQYVPSSHPWFVDALENPASPYTDHFVFQGEGNTDPLHLSLEFEHEGQSLAIDLPDIVTLNLQQPGVAEFQRRLFAHWLDPLGQGNSDNGVDGFRLDHVMDDLDGKGVLVDLLGGFWRPLIDHLRDIEPNVFFLAEPADWGSFGGDLLRGADIDGAFAMPLMFAIRSFDKAAIVQAIDDMCVEVPAAKHAFTTLENHDVSRFASSVGEVPGKERVGAALLFTLPGVPTLYYGQEIGMLGDVGTIPSDYHLPAREAFRWSEPCDAPGMAVWYRNRPIWQTATIKRDDGRTLEAQRYDTTSLFSWYRRLIELRRRSVALREGDLALVPTACDEVLAFVRRHTDESVLVAVNLSAQPQRVRLDLDRVNAPTPSPAPRGDGWGEVTELPTSSVKSAGTSLIGEPLELIEPVVLGPYAVAAVQIDGSV